MKIDKKHRALLLLCSLPISYNDLITTLVYEKEILNFEKVVGVLRSNEQREKLCKGSPNSEVLAMIRCKGDLRRGFEIILRVDQSLKKI